MIKKKKRKKKKKKKKKKKEKINLLRKCKRKVLHFSVLSRN